MSGKSDILTLNMGGGSEKCQSLKKIYGGAIKIIKGVQEKKISARFARVENLAPPGQMSVGAPALKNFFLFRLILYDELDGQGRSLRFYGRGGGYFFTFNIVIN